LNFQYPSFETEDLLPFPRKKVLSHEGIIKEINYSLIIVASLNKKYTIKRNWYYL